MSVYCQPGDISDNVIELCAYLLSCPRYKSMLVKNRNFFCTPPVFNSSFRGSRRNFALIYASEKPESPSQGYQVMTSTLAQLRRAHTSNERGVCLFVCLSVRHLSQNWWPWMTLNDRKITLKNVLGVTGSYLKVISTRLKRKNLKYVRTRSFHHTSYWRALLI